LANSYRMELALNRHMPIVDRDHDLIHRVAAGDEPALRELYDRYGQRMYAYALRITCSPDAAEEAVQESLIAAWQSAGKFRGQGRAIAWLLGIVHHKALNQLRGRVDVPLEEGLPDLLDGGPQPDEQAASGEQRRLLLRGLESLSADHRAVLDLVFYQGLSLAETAQVCSCALGTVKSRLNQAKARLRGALGRAGLREEDLGG
jgi:RNA polymerase sigma-70 factor, ECF subfamily